jgi:hypothetical protein
MNSKEAIETLKGLTPRWSSNPNDYDKAGEAIRLAIAALQPWCELAKEEPPEVGLYRTYDENADRDCVRFQDHLWDGSDFMGNHTVHSPTHWKHRVGPEE